ncbi:amidohydrolase [Marinilabilia salmonicolor]|uniref:Omega-amidase YafV n=1 Tax=Marinilabilia salmonicolor TaxID=989 RepID=A0A368VBT6_9BACT|nr:amidohydrolase [Marinilabilia salmonicolor]RCW38727.1 putative amidohydrolase [Marinilabilia salmonicolor]
MKVALLQPELYWENIDRNLKMFENLFERLENNCSLVVLPEMFTTGFTMNPEKIASSALTETPRWLQLMAEKYQFSLAGSSIASEENNFYNRFYFASPAVKVKYYDKRHLFRMSEEQNHYSAGKERKIFSLGEWRILPQVCYDLRFPVWSRNRNDYDILIYVANWPAVRQDVWNTLLKARAIENQCYVLGVNRTGKAPGIDYQGGSVVLSPKGAIISRKSSENPNILYADLDRDEMNAFREKFPAWKDADYFEIVD